MGNIIKCGKIEDESNVIISKIYTLALEKFKEELLESVTNCIKAETSQFQSDSKSDSNEREKTIK